jgi:hypothetical protein
MTHRTMMTKDPVYLPNAEYSGQPVLVSAVCSQMKIWYKVYHELLYFFCVVHLEINLSSSDPYKCTFSWSKPQQAERAADASTTFSLPRIRSQTYDAWERDSWFWEVGCFVIRRVYRTVFEIRFGFSCRRRFVNQLCWFFLLKIFLKSSGVFFSLWRRFSPHVGTSV